MINNLGLKGTYKSILRGGREMDILMIAALLVGFALIWLLIKWSQKQIDS